MAQVKHLVLSSQSRLAILEDKTSFISQNWEKRKGRKDVPNKNPYFTGRLEALEEIQNWINGGDRKVFAVCGLGGMGKTSLVIESNWKWSEKFPAGIFWLTADDHSSELETNLEASLKTFCLKLNLGNETMSPVDAVSTFLGELEEDFLLVVDNLDQEELSTTTNKLVNGRWLQNKHARLMVTTRLAPEVISDRIAVPLATLTLTNLSLAEGSLFLERKTGISPQDQIGERISDELGGLPLALEQSGSFIKVTKCSYEVYFEKLQSKKLELLKKGKATKPNEEVNSKNRLAVATTWNIHMEWMEINCYPAFYLMQVLAFLPSSGVHRCILNEGSPRITPENVAEAMSDELDLVEVVSILKLFSLFR